MLYQNVGSSYCAVYSVANLRELCGEKADRKTAFARFEAKSGNLPRVTHAKILHVMQSFGAYRWEKRPKFDFNTIRNALPEGEPTLLTFRIAHRTGRIRGEHCAIALNSNWWGIWIIDVHGRRDRGDKANARICAYKTPGRGWEIEGTPFFLVPGRVCILKAQ